jgi:Tol biopolymer transport system component
VFTRAGNNYGDETLFSANIDGSGEVQLGTATGACCPWASPDGKLIGRTQGTGDVLHQVFSAIDGSGEFELVPPAGKMFGSGPISVDGRIVLEGFSNPGFQERETYIANVDGSDVRVLTKEHFIPGDFSPDGKTVVLFKPVGADDDHPVPPGELWLVGADGKNLRRLTPAGLQVQCCFNFRWSPDGSKILFANPNGSLQTIAPDGTGLATVFHLDQAWAVTPTWSPDGSMILFALDPQSNPFRHPVNALAVIRSDGTGLTEVLRDSTFKREPIWLP